MKAIVLTRYGDVDVLQAQEIAEPTPGPHQVLVRVRASAVNDWDFCFMRGKPQIYRLLFGLSRPKVRVLGTELAGLVEAVGESVQSFVPGDAVYGDVSEAGFGGFAERACVHERALSKMPSAMSFEQAASLPHAGLLALQGLVDLGGIREGEKILINGAGGGVGMFGVQIAKRYGAEVTGVDGAAKLSALESMGFDHVIDYRTTDFTRSGERYDLILDTKTTRSPLAYARALRPGGRYVTVGGLPSKLIELLCAAPLISALTGKRFRILALAPNRGIESLHAMFERGELRFVIDGPYPLDDLKRAMQRFGNAEHIGKVVIAV